MTSLRNRENRGEVKSPNEAPNQQDQMLSLNTKTSEFYKGKMPEMKRTPYTFLEQNFLLVQDKS